MKNKDVPVAGIEDKEVPAVGMQYKKIDDTYAKTKELPAVGNPENTVLIGDTLVEVKPTKLKYHRNNVASFYKIVDMVPIPDIMLMNKGTFGDDRDGDKALMDWLIAVVDDEKLIVENYNEMDTGTIEKLLEIFKRVNKINEKEERQKNVESRMREE